MSTRPADRVWECMPGNAWQRVLGVDETCLILASGIRVVWRLGVEDVPNRHLRLRYTVAVKGVWMAWREGAMDLLTQDFDRPDLTKRIRNALAGQRHSMVM